MKQLFAPLGIIILLLASCSSSEKKQEADTITDESAVIANEKPESVHPEHNISFKIQTFEEKKGDNELKIEYPVEGNPGLLLGIREWINEQITGSYRGDLDNAEGFFRYYANRLGTDPDLAEYGGFTKDEFDLEYLDEYLVTYNHISYEYLGGAHGSGGAYGTSFLQSDGTIFTKDCFTSYEPLHEFFIQGLKRYFKVENNSELMECLLNVKALGALPAPAMHPWVVEEGVMFSYTPYEIAPYSAGSPHFVIPVDDLKPFLSERGKRFFGL